jgi:HAD superfamily 5'-nucleotidase-like hydrolase
VGQLPLPLARPTGEAPAPVPRSQRIFVNRNLRLDQIAWVGFDMDYTLAIYRQDAMDRISIEQTVKKMVENKGRPESLLTLPFDTSFPIRGLFVDKKLGNVLKMDRYRYVKRAYHGMRRLTRDERRQLYASRPIRPGTKRFHWVDTLYALPEVTLYAAAVAHLESLAGAGAEALDYAALFDEVRECIDLCHQDGSIVDVIASHPDEYLVKDPSLGPALHKLRSSGKRLFLLTNSRPAYTQKIMSWLLDGALPEYARWQSYFDVIVCAAKKPRFFTEMAIPFVPGEPDLAPPTEHFEDGRIYEGGCLHELERLLAGTHGAPLAGDEVFYVGDHIYGDVLRTKKETAWRTMMIVQEMAAEIAVHDARAEELRRLDALHDAREQALDELRGHQVQLKGVERQIDEQGRASAALGAARVALRRSIERAKTRLAEIEAEHDALDAAIDHAFHPYWGSAFSTGEELTTFGDQVEQYACLYTGRVSNLLQYSPTYYFRGPRDRMPHEY